MQKQKAEKCRKKLANLESQLVLASPNLILKLKTSTGKSTGTFFLSSEYDRCQWIETIETLKACSFISWINILFILLFEKRWCQARLTNVEILYHFYRGSPQRSLLLHH